MPAQPQVRNPNAPAQPRERMQRQSALQPGHPQERQYNGKEFSIYGVNFAAIAPGTQQQSSFTIDSDGDFFLQKLMYMADIAAAGQQASTRVIPLCTINIVDSGSGRAFTQIPVSLDTIMGSGELPFILTEVKIFPARATVTVQIANYDAANTYNLRLTFGGTKAYY